MSTMRNGSLSASRTEAAATFRRSLRPGCARLPRVPGENFLRLTLWGFPPAMTLPSKEECRKHSQNRKRPLQPSCPAAGQRKHFIKCCQGDADGKTLYITARQPLSYPSERDTRQVLAARGKFGDRRINHLNSH